MHEFLKKMIRLQFQKWEATDMTFLEVDAQVNNETLI